MTMPPEHLELVRKSWKPWRGLVDWRAHKHGFKLNLLSDVSPCPDYEVDLASMSATTDRVYITAEDCGYHHQGDTWEWWNIIYEGHIIDCERFDSRYEKYRDANVF